jgi:hypothetical protein
VTTGGGVSAINLGNAQILSVVGAGPYSVQALVAGTQYTLDGPTYTTAAAASSAIVALSGAVGINALLPAQDPTVTTGGSHDV